MRSPVHSHLVFLSAWLPERKNIIDCLLLTSRSESRHYVSLASVKGELLKLIPIVLNPED